MSVLSSPPQESGSTTNVTLTAAESALLEQFDQQRRLQLLRVIVPGLLTVAVAAVPFAVYADITAGGYTSTLQVLMGVVPFAVGLWAIRSERVNLASFALFAGLASVIAYLILSDGPLQGMIDLSAIPEFTLLVLPICVAGIFGGTRSVALATGAAVAFTLGTVLLTPHGRVLASTMAQPDGLAVFTVPLATQIAIGVLMLAVTRGFRRTLRQLGSVQLAYEREKELDRLKDHFISSVNHELRTPIMALQGYLELARELGRRGLAARQEQMLARGTQAVEHLALLVRSVLNVRRIETDAVTVTPMAFTLRPAVLAATQLLDPRELGEDGPGARPLYLRVPANLAVFADADRVREVVLNLLSNAVKYSPAGSAVEIAARVLPAEAPQRAGAGVHRQLVEVAVRDHGLGIPPEQANLLFRRFVRLERDIASPVWGTGLGLAICRAYVEAMGGTIRVESSGVAGEGATFAFTLPLSAAPPATAAATPVLAEGAAIR